jgi:hypothetical protein
MLTKEQAEFHAGCLVAYMLHDGYTCEQLVPVLQAGIAQVKRGEYLHVNDCCRWKTEEKKPIVNIWADVPEEEQII